MHLPFLATDPDTIVDVDTRGAWTDEGLYSMHALNFLNVGQTPVRESSIMIRGPLQTLIQIPVFFIFGKSLVVSRLLVLLTVMLAFFLLSQLKGYELFAFIFPLISLTQFHVFQFSHYGMAEMMSTSLILISLYFIIRYYKDEKKRIKWIFLSALMLFFSYSLKIQFLYALALLPATIFILELTTLVRREKSLKEALNPFLLSTGFTIGFILIYFLAWYLPHIEFYNKVMLREADGRYPEFISQYPGAIKFWMIYLFSTQELKSYLLTFLILLLVSIFIFFFRLRSQIMLIPIVFSLVWILAEFHKFPMTYLPHRYLVSLYVAIGLFCAVIFTELAKIKNAGWIIVGLSLILAFMNSTDNYKAFAHRTFDLHNLNTYFSNYNLENQLVLGSWAPNCTRKTKARTIPVWNHFMNHEDPISKFKPRIIISETDESDSDEAYKSQGIDLEAISDSVRVFPVWRYKVGVYWVKGE